MTGLSAVPGVPALPEFITAPRFPPSSRYAEVAVAQLTPAGGAVVPYLCRRFCPDPAALADFGTHVVVQGDRLDRIAAGALGDPEQFWRLCDANRALDPDELVAHPGRRLRVTLPPGVPAPAPFDG